MDATARFIMEQGILAFFLFLTYRFITGPVWKWFTSAAFPVMVAQAERRSAAHTTTALAVTELRIMYGSTQRILENYLDVLRVMSLHMAGQRTDIVSVNTAMARAESAAAFVPPTPPVVPPVPTPPTETKGVPKDGKLN